MPTLGFLPSTDSKLLEWSVNFNAKLVATPTAYGMTAAQATAYTALHTAFATAMTAAVDPSTRTKATIATKDLARANLKVLAGSYGKMVGANTTVTDAQKIGLGLNVRGTPVPVPPPSTAPAIVVLSVSGWTCKVRLKDTASGSKRGKPPGVSGATILSYVGATPPTDMAQWKFEGNLGRTSVDVVFSPVLPGGTRVWLTAFWFNGRKESGPACAPVGTNLQGGTVSMAA